MTAPFASVWAAELAAFLEFKRALGYPYRRAEFVLRALDRFLADRRPRSGGLHEALLAWFACRPGRKPWSVACELGVVRQFYTYLQQRSGRRLPEPSWPRLQAKSDYVPHIFTILEVKHLLRLTTKLGGHPFRKITYRTLILVLYCTGLRFGEAMRLRLRDLDATTGTLFILPSKGRSRWVPYHPSLGRELKRYLAARRAYASAGPDDLLFVGIDRTRLPVNTASQTICGLLRAAGLKPARGRAGPRPYDFRHAFAVHRLIRWYRDGIDLHARLPWLSAYMGHDDLLGTETYLTATPELLALAGGRFRRHYRKAGGRR